MSRKYIIIITKPVNKNKVWFFCPTERSFGILIIKTAAPQMRYEAVIISWMINNGSEVDINL